MNEMSENLEDAVNRPYREDYGLQPWRLYTAREVAALLGLDRVRTVYDIADAELPRCYVGPNRGAIRYLGADVLCYVKGLDPIDYESVIGRLREKLERPTPVTPLLTQRSGKRRVL